MKAYWIDAGARTVSPIDYVDGTLHRLFEGGIDIAAQFESGDVLYVDGECLLRPATVAFRIKRRPDGQPMMSNGAMTGPDRGEMINGDYVEATLPPIMSLTDLEDEIEWLTVEQALDWFRAKAKTAQPAVTVNDTSLATWGEFLEIMTAKKE